MDSVSLSPDKIFPDNYTRREIMGRLAKCPYSSAEDNAASCGVVLPVSDLEKHIESEHTGSNPMLNDSGLLECPYREVGCTVNFREDQREKHLEKEVHKHLQLMLTAYSRLKVVSSSRTNLEYPGATDYLRQESRDSNNAWPLDGESPEDYQFRRQRSWDSVRFARKQNIRPSSSRFASGSGSQAWQTVCEEPLPPHECLQRFVQGTPTSTYHSSGSHMDGTCGSSEKSKLNGQASSGGGGGVDPHLQDVFQRLVLLEQMNREKQIKINKLESEANSMRSLCAEFSETIKDFRASRYCNGVYVWKIPHFRAQCLALRRNPNQVLHSSGFYTSMFGYKICLRFNLNVPSSVPVDVPLEKDEETLLSLYVHFMQGEFDNSISWPFQGEMTLMIIHPKNPEEHITEAILSKPEAAAFAKPTSRRNLKGIGYPDFCSIHKIFNNDYVKDDAIEIKIIAKSLVD